MFLVIALIISLKTSDTNHDNYFIDVKKTEYKSEEDLRLKQGIEQKNSIISIHLKPETSVADITELKNFLDKQEMML